MRLNLGCGRKKLDNYINVDIYAEMSPEVVWDLENFPWPWEENSVDEIFMSHVLEHLGQQPIVFLNVVKEAYRILKINGIWKIKVPHPRSDIWLMDPTHVRPITPVMMGQFSRRRIREETNNVDEVPAFALHLGVDFEIENISYVFTPQIKDALARRVIAKDDIDEWVNTRCNVIAEISMDMRKVAL